MLRNTDISFGKNINIIVGDNESGKSTLLEAVNLALTGQINRRPAAYELHPYLFNRETVLEFIRNLKAKNAGPPPEVLIELYFEAEEELANFKGVNNSLKDDQAHGLYLKITLDENYFLEEYATYISDVDAVNDIPIEYYTIEWRNFAWSSTLSRQAIPFKSVLIDPSSISNSYAANKYVTEMLRDHLSKSEKVKLALSYRNMRDQFQNDDRIKSINEELEKQKGQVSDKTLSVAMDTTTRASWETGVLPHLEDIPLTLVGKGEQNAIKIKLAIAASEACDLFLMEEPENHLSHTNLGRLISHISERCSDKQLILSTHSSFVLNKLGIENVIMFDGIKGVTLNNLRPDTKSYFKRLPGHQTLRMILAKYTILVEGPSDELIVQKGFKQTHGIMPLEAGVEVISVGTSFKRFLDIARLLQIRVAVVRDNDGNSAKKIALFGNYEGCDNITVCIDTDDTCKTLEPQLIKSNGLLKLNSILGTEFNSTEKLDAYMTANKTECAHKLHEHTKGLVIPDYIQKAIDNTNV